MKSEKEIIDKMNELKRQLSEIENKLLWKTKKESIQVEFLKNNIAFIEWALT